MCTIGKQIKKYRKEKGLTQKELGKLLGVSGAMIAQYETGKREPKPETISKIAKALEISMIDLIQHDDIYNAFFHYIDKDTLDYVNKISNFLDVRKKRSSQEDFLNYLYSLGFDIEKYDDLNDSTFNKECEDDFVISIGDPSRDSMVFLHKNDFINFKQKIDDLIALEILYLTKLNK